MVDSIKLCIIIENLHFWAINHLRPWLSSCIDQWRRSIEEGSDSEVESDTSEPNFGLRRAATLENFLEHEQDTIDEEDDGEYEDEEASEDDEDEDEEEEEEEEETEDEYEGAREDSELEPLYSKLQRLLERKQR